jgi:hypothetical protein
VPFRAGFVASLLFVLLLPLPSVESSSLTYVAAEFLQAMLSDQKFLQVRACDIEQYFFGY